MPELFSEGQENLPPMFSQVMALIENDEPDVGVLQCFNGGLCPLAQPRQGPVLANFLPAHFLPMFLHLLLKIIRVFHAKILKPRQTRSLVDGFTVLNQC